MKCTISELLFNVMTRMILGKRYYGENAEISEEAKNFREIANELHRVAGGSAMDDFIPLIHLFSKSKEKHREVHERRDKFLPDLIEEIQGINGSKPNIGKSMIEVLLSLQESDPNYYTDEIIKGIIAVLFQAGNDTSVATMEWAMSLLLNNPKVLEKAQSEIDTLVGPGRLINDSDLAHLPYLNSIIKETLRMFPVLPFFLPHQSSGKTAISGFYVPKGTMVFINAWAIHNDPEIWNDPKGL